MEMSSVPLEELLGAKTAEQSLWQKVKSYVTGFFKKKTFFELNDFQLVSDQGYPKNQTICIYIWKDKNEQLSWQTGIYNQKLKHFSVRYGTTVYAINEDKVIAWKKMNADAVALEIMDLRNQKQSSKARDKMGKEQIFLQGQVIVQNDKDVLQERCTTEVISMLYLS